MIKYYSELLNKNFDTLKEAEAAEKEVIEKEAKEKSDKAASAKAVEEAFEKANAIVEKAREEFVQAMVDADEVADKYRKKYGEFHFEENKDGKMVLVPGKSKSAELFEAMIDMFNL